MLFCIGNVDNLAKQAWKRGKSFRPQLRSPQKIANLNVLISNLRMRQKSFILQAKRLNTELINICETEKYLSLK